MRPPDAGTAPVGQLKESGKQLTPTDPGHENGDVDAEMVAELRRLARSRPTSGRGAIAKAGAIRTLERLRRDLHRRPVPPKPDGWYPHEPGDPFYELDWMFLHEHPDILQRHWEQAWREGPA